MQQQRRRNRLIIGLMALGLLAGAALTGSPAQAVDAVGPYYAVPSWDRKMGAVNRFVVLTDWNSEAVLDKETGLVWERSPSTNVHLSSTSAGLACLTRIIGNRTAWRLPSVHELASLVDPSVAPPGPTLPAGHPFLTVQSTVYWSATDGHLPANPVNIVAWEVSFFDGSVTSSGSDFGFLAWCVRGRMNADRY